jgi:hypothetical protein
MNILFVAEKASLSRCIAPHARLRWPTANITFLHAVPFANFKFSYPRGLSARDFPFLSEPTYRINDWDTWFHKAYVMTFDGALSETVTTERMFIEADIIVYACDPDHTGAVTFHVLMEHVFGDERAYECPALRCVGLADRDIAQAFADMRPFGQTLRESLEYGLVKQHFDWNWNVNSLAILGDTQRRVGVPDCAPPMSKYALQLLYYLREQPSMPDGQVLRAMEKWSGTGRYQYQPGEWRPRLGSPTSVGQIIDNLLTAGLLQRTRAGKLQCLHTSARGQDFLADLHPGCEDSDLPFRLDEWCKTGQEARRAIARYVNTFFGRQKRYLASKVGR